MSGYGSYYQLDIPRLSPFTYEIPKEMPGRLFSDDFVYFIYDGTQIDPKDYSVAMESLDTAGPTYRVFSPLLQAVELPSVQIGYASHILLLPNTEDKPRFISYLNRGSTYIVPTTVKKYDKGIYFMKYRGKITTGLPEYYA